MTYLTLEERKLIGKMYNNEHLSFRSMGKILHRSHTTLRSEILDNTTTYQKHYDPEESHRRFLLRQAKKGKRKKIERNSALKEYIVTQLTIHQWSPDEIAGTLRTAWNRTMVCHETIYQYIYSEEGKRLKLWLHLRHKKKPLRIQRGSRKQRREIIPDRTPLVVRGEKKFGDIESDSMIFSKQRSILSVQAESVSKRCCLTKLPNKSASETEQALRRSMDYYGEDVVRSITFDNGTENTTHTNLKKDFKIETYFCDPYCSWQKGLVENTNKLIRQYLPRWINLEQMTDQDIYEIQEKLNNRPRKSLDYKTPNQIFFQLAESGRI